MEASRNCVAEVGYHRFDQWTRNAPDEPGRRTCLDCGTTFVYGKGYEKPS